MNSPSWLPSPLAPLTTVAQQSPSALHWFTSRELLVPASWDSYHAADVPQTPQLRAQILRHWVVHDGALSHESAQWVHLGGAPAAIVHVTSPRALRNNARHRRLHCASLDLTSAPRLGPTRVTSRIRTACDLARRVPEPELTPTQLLDRVTRIAALLDACGELEEACAQIEHLHRQPGKAAASKVLAQIARLRLAGLL